MLFFPSKFIKIELLSAAVSFLHYTYTYTIWMRTQHNPIEKYGRIELQPSRRGFLLRNQQKLGLKWTTVLILFSLSVGFCLISFSIKFSVHEGVRCMHLICQTFESGFVYIAVDAASLVSTTNFASTIFKTIRTNIFYSKNWMALMKLPWESDNFDSSILSPFVKGSNKFVNKFSE